MNTVLQQQQRAGRFGRAVPADETQTDEPADAVDERLKTLGYTVDSSAVADAIVERLLAGRTLGLPRR